MKLEKDVKTVEVMAQQRKDENWEFRCFLKATRISSSRIDSVVHGLYREVSAQIDCTECANCCKVVMIPLTEADIKRLARLMEMSVQDFRSSYLQKDEEDGDRFKAQPCPFLKDNRCSVYESRPEVCRSYPHLHKKDFAARLNQAYFNCSVCPIVFNVYEGLAGTLLV